MEQSTEQPITGGLSFDNPPQSMESLFADTSKLELPIEETEQLQPDSKEPSNEMLPDVRPVGEEEPKPWDFSEDDYREAEKEVKEGRGTPETSTRATLGMIKYGWPRLLGAMSKTDWKQYRPDPEEEKDLYNAFFNYYEATGKRMNPVLQLVLIGGMYLVATGWQAYDNHKEKDQINKAKERANAIKKEREKGNYGKANKMAADTSSLGLSEEILNRQRFDLSSKGTYRRHWKTGKYIKGIENQNEYPIPELKAIIVRMNEEQTSEKEINEACISYLQNLKHGA